MSAIIIALAVANFTVIRADVRAQRRHLSMLSRRLDLNLLREMGAAHRRAGVPPSVDRGSESVAASGVTEIDFLIFMLVQTKGLDINRDIEPLRKVI